MRRLRVAYGFRYTCEPERAIRPSLGLRCQHNFMFLRRTLQKNNRSLSADHPLLAQNQLQSVVRRLLMFPTARHDEGQFVSLVFLLFALHVFGDHTVDLTVETQIACSLDSKKIFEVILTCSFFRKPERMHLCACVFILLSRSHMLVFFACAVLHASFQRSCVSRFGMSTTLFDRHVTL